jgi:hypothetical protein
MDYKKEEDNVKVTAVDTGKRVDVSEVQRSTIVRKRTALERHEKRGKVREVKKVEEEAPVIHRPRIIPEPEPEQRIPLYVEPVEFDDSGDFMSMLLESESGEKNITFKVGDKISGKIVHIGKDNIFVSIGPKAEASMSISELLDTDGNLTVRMGQKISSYVVSIHGGITLSNNVAQS